MEHTKVEHTKVEEKHTEIENVTMEDAEIVESPGTPPPSPKKGGWFW